MKYGYEETRKISYDSLRGLCIANDWYSNGSNEEYDNLLESAAGIDNITCDDLVEIATDIKSHSDTDFDIETIMYLINHICNVYFTEI